MLLGKQTKDKLDKVIDNLHTNLSTLTSDNAYRNVKSLVWVGVFSKVKGTISDDFWGTINLIVQNGNR
jgi:hypothetical protein